MLDLKEAWRARVEGSWQNAVLSALPVPQAALSAINHSFPAASVELQPDGTLVKKNYAESDKQMLDEGLRTVLANLINSAVEANKSVMEYCCPENSQPCVPRLLDMALMLTLTPEQGTQGQLSSFRLLDPNMFCTLMEDAMEQSTIAECHQIFAYLESKMSELQRPDFFQRTKLILLRICNHLLKRLSKSHDGLLCGNVLMFMSRLFPLSERSGFNLQGSYNTNIRTPIDDVGQGAFDSSGEPLDAKLYKTFWNLQAVFQYPPQLSQPGLWHSTCNHISTVLEHFKNHPIASSGGAASGGHPEGQVGEVGVQYLSSASLFGLQLRDATFRRQWLTQVLVLIHSLNYPGKQEIFKGGKPPSDLAPLEKKVLELLALTPESGSEYVSALTSVLSRESWWVTWKKDSCNTFERPPAPSNQELQAKLQQQQQQQEHLAKRRRLGANSHHRGAAGGGGGAGATAGRPLDQVLSIPEDNMAGLKREERHLLPDIREFLAPVISDMDPENGIEEEYKTKKNKIYMWEAQRLLARCNLEVFSMSRDNLDTACEKVFPDLFPAKANKDDGATTPNGAVEDGGDGAKVTPQTPRGANTSTLSDDTRRTVKDEMMADGEVVSEAVTDGV